MLAQISVRRSALELFVGVSRHARYAIGAAAVMATLITFGTTKQQYQPQPLPGFADRWSPVPMRAVIPVKQVKTLSYIQNPPPQAAALPEIEGLITTPMPPPPVNPVNNPPPKIASARAEENISFRRETKGPDICRGKGRVYKRGGKSWRCRR